MALPALVAGGGPVVALTDRLISEGIRLGASDIHVEPSRTRVRVRYRVDGVLIEGTEVGEETGDLSGMLLCVSDVYESEVDNAVAALISVVEPALIVGMALVVGFIVIALFLPIVGVIERLQ